MEAEGATTMLRLRGEQLQVEVQAAQQGDLEMGLI